MNKNFQILFPNFNNLTTSIQFRKFRLILLLLSGLLFIEVQETKSEEIYLKCTGKFEINRGALIQPVW